jgi:hypothetical protein
MIRLVRGACSRCAYQATVGIGRDEGATVPVHWAPANCPACGLVSVNIYSYGPDSDPCCHECDERVDFYVDWGMVPKPPEGWACPKCGELALGFRPADA